MSARELYAALALICLALALPVHAEETVETPEGVDEFMNYHLGRWESTTSYFNRKGEVVKTSTEGYGEVNPVLSTPLRTFTIGVIVAGYAAAVYAVGGFVQLVVIRIGHP